MPYVIGIIAIVLLAFAGAQLTDPVDTTLFASFFAGSLLAFMSLQRNVSLLKARFLAVSTTAVMFFYFASFFRYCPAMPSDWYMQDRAMDVIGLLIAAFAMIPVLSVYSCYMKAECHMRKKPEKPVVHTVSSAQEHHAG